MRSFHELSGQEALSLALSLCSRASLPRRSEAFCLIEEMLWDISRGELPGACRSYHAAVAAMLRSPAPRATGDLWRDELLRCIALEEHPFALSAAGRRRDPALMAAMGEELQTMRELYELSSRDILAMLKDRKPRSSGRDGISAVSTALWSGANTRPLPRPAPEEAPGPVLPLAFTPWEYGPGSLEGDYAAQEALEELYMRFMQAEDWAALTEDLYSFFRAYGCGPFLKDRAFALRDGELAPLPPSAITPLEPVSLYEEQHVALMENTIAFMRGEPCRHTLLYGEAGLGKTAHVAALLHELPEVRLIAAARQDIEGLAALLPRLAGQPLRFILLLDDVPPDCREVRSFASRSLGLKALPENVILYATSREQPEGSVFPGALRFSYPTLPQFTSLIAELMECRGLPADRQAVHNAAVDHQVDVREKLTFQGALAIAEALAGK